MNRGPDRTESHQDRAGTTAGQQLLVSVVVVTYNHESYIRQSLDAVLAQRTDFDFEVIVSEDCSTDGTRSIIHEYRERYPDRIRLLLSERNLCSNEVLIRAFSAARGRYVALLDGDDFWTSSSKLQKQVDFLDRHLECILCFHDVLEVFEDGSYPSCRRHEGVDPGVSIKTLTVSNPICTASVMIRREVLRELPAWYAGSVFGDWELFILAALRGRIGFIDEAMAVYRRHGGGYWIGTAVTRQIELVLAFYDQMIRHLESPYRELLRQERRKYPVQLAVERAGIPLHATVLVASGGDYGLLYLNGRYTEHFPRGDDYMHLALDPADSARAAVNLEERRAEGAHYLVVPEHAFDWFSRSEAFRHHLERNYPCVLGDEACLVYRLDPSLEGTGADIEAGATRTGPSNGRLPRRDVPE